MQRFECEKNSDLARYMMMRRRIIIRCGDFCMRRGGILSEVVHVLSFSKVLLIMTNQIGIFQGRRKIKVPNERLI